MLEPEEPVPETTGVPPGLVATEPGLVTVPPGLTTVVTVPEGLLEPEPPPTLVPSPPALTTGTGVETTGVGVETVVGFPLPDVGLVEPKRVGVTATGREVEAEPECRCDRVEPPRVATLVPVPVRVVIAEAAAARLAPDRGLTTATAARPREEEA
jgi:hypothetical protein